jgi:lysophospholipase L1-like esterase
MKIKQLVLLIAIAAPCVAQQPYERGSIWANEINAFLDVDRRQTPPDRPVLFTGSSSIRLWRTLREDFPGLKVMNRGFGGSRLDDLVHYAPQIVLPYRPSRIVIYSGENDIADGQPAEDVLADFRAFMAFRDRSLPGTPVVYISIKPSPLRWEMWPEMSKANSLIRAEAAKMRRVSFADLAAAMLGPDGKPMPDIFVADRLHMNEKGYAIWKRELAKYLR